MTTEPINPWWKLDVIIHELWPWVYGFCGHFLTMASRLISINFHRNCVGFVVKVHGWLRPTFTMSLWVLWPLFDHGLRANCGQLCPFFILFLWSKWPHNLTTNLTTNLWTVHGQKSDNPWSTLDAEHGTPVIIQFSPVFHASHPKLTTGCPIFGHGPSINLWSNYVATLTKETK